MIWLAAYLIGAAATVVLVGAAIAQDDVEGDVELLAVALVVLAWPLSLLMALGIAWGKRK